MYYNLLCGLNILLWSISPLLSRQIIISTHDPFNMANLRYIYAGIISLFLLFFYSKKTLTSYNIKIYILMAIIAIMGFVAKYVNFLLLEKYKTAIVSAIVAPAALITTSILGMLFFNEPLTYKQLSGIGIISLGIFVLMKK